MTLKINQHTFKKYIMKKVFITLLAFTISAVSMAQKKVADVAQFKSETIDLGKIKVGNPTTALFSVTNVSKDPLIIETANPTCGCTIGDYTKEPITPGKNGEIKATYNAANLGVFEKHLTVKFAGVDELKSITIKGEVLSAEDFSKLAPTVPVKATAAVATSNKTTVKKAKVVKKS
jgi:DNA-binding protein YbaB